MNESMVCTGTVGPVNGDVVTLRFGNKLFNARNDFGLTESDSGQDFVAKIESNNDQSPSITKLIIAEIPSHSELLRDWVRVKLGGTTQETK